MRAGKPVLIQKPMARTGAECRRILDAARRTGVAVFVSFMHRYFEEVDAVRELLEGGTLGSLHSVRQRNATPGADWAAWFYRRQEAGGGVVKLYLANQRAAAAKAITEVAVQLTVPSGKPSDVLAAIEALAPEAQEMTTGQPRDNPTVLGTHEG